MANFLNSTLTSIARWYRPADRLKPGQVAEQVKSLLQGLLISAPLAEVRGPWSGLGPGRWADGEYQRAAGRSPTVTA
jgi:hypothetical protein